MSDPGSNPSNEVPPTPVTRGCEAGSSTAMAWAFDVPSCRQSKAPSSPDAAVMLCPCMAIWVKATFSATAAPAPMSGSHKPQLVLIESARSSEAIFRYSSIVV